MLRFPDGTQVRVIGLDEILADVYSEDRQTNKETAEEIIKRLESQQNYIPSSDLARKEFAYVLLKEYKEYTENQNNKKQ
jgi:predicted nucleic-acid-binding protein